MLKVLRRLKERGYIQNGADINQETADALHRLTELGLVDPGYEETATGKPFIWVSNGNGERVIKHLETNHRYKVVISSRARTALAALSDEDRESVRAGMEVLVLHDLGAWTSDRVMRISKDKPVYLLRVTPDLRAFIRVSAPSAEIELYDLVREEALNLFREHQVGAPQ